MGNVVEVLPQNPRDDLHTKIHSAQSTLMDANLF